MTPDKTAITAYQGQIRRSIEATGMKLEVRYDFANWPELNKEAGRGALTPVIDPDWVTIEDGKFFSVAGRDAMGRLCHMQSARLVDLEGASLAENLMAWRDLYCSQGLEMAPWSSLVSSPVSWRLRGTAAYQGEMWIAPQWRGFKLAPQLIVFMMMETLRAWWPDTIFALTLPVTSNQDFARKVGYEDCEPEAFSWHKENGDLVRKEGLVWAERSHLLAHAEVGYALSEEVDLNRLGHPGEAGQRVAVG